MPLLLPVLIDKLLKLDDPSGPQDPASTGQKWFDAFWGYGSGMVFLLPGGQALVQGPFVATMAGVSVPGPAAQPFFTALEAAMRAAWATLGTPAGLTPPLLSAVPAPAPLAPMLASVVPLGLASPGKPPPRIQVATMIDAWTRTHIVVGPLGPVGSFS